jgi:predicted neutral ceramidase superfamily lipid hydrolase
MSFNKKYLPTKKELINILSKNGSNNFYIGYVKTVDAYIGSSESMDFIDEFVSKWRESENEFYDLG